jgi:6,7-dimethyl-8-ribityllumazine synthase
MIDFGKKKVALVVSQFYSDLSTLMVEGATRKFLELGGELENLSQFHVPGTFEIPQAAQQLVDRGEFHAIVCLGVVIRGETAHFDYVCKNVTRGLGEIAQRAQIPVIFGILTTLDRAQAEARLGGSKGHKGAQAMEAALGMMKTLDLIQNT